MYADGGLYAFSVGPLTWDGNDFLDGIRDNSQWGKIKKFISEQGLPFVFDVVKDVSKSKLASMTATALAAIVNNI